MCLSTQTMSDIQSTLQQFESTTGNPVAMLKECFPELTFVRMSDSDMDVAPFASLPLFNLYLLDAREHCVQLTSNLEHATGVVVTQRG